jgi:uncharacterized protein YecE (DUF72 family)
MNYSAMTKQNLKYHMEEKIHIGTSGWSYKHWKEIFYPKGLKNTDWLPFYSQSFHCTEINSSFYRIPKKETVQHWVEKVPSDFFFCPKMSRYLTHLKRLHDPEEPLDHFFDVFDPMKKQMGPVLIQLPPSLKFNIETADHLFGILKKDYGAYRFALEGRHPTWLEPEAIDLLTKYKIAFVIAHSGHEFPYAEFVTAKHIYIRFHGPDQLFSSLYTKELLQKFARLMRKWRKENHIVWAFFNNDVHGYALVNGWQLMDQLKIGKPSLIPASSLHTNHPIL